MKEEFYKMPFNAWDQETHDLSLDEEAALLRVWNAIHRHHEPVPKSLRHLSSLWRCHLNKARFLLDRLLNSGLIVETPDGKLANPRAMVLLDDRVKASMQ